MVERENSSGCNGSRVPPVHHISMAVGCNIKTRILTHLELDDSNMCLLLRQSTLHLVSTEVQVRCARQHNRSKAYGNGSEC
jgi:hypothetical protein